MSWPKGKPRKPELYGTGAALEAAEADPQIKSEDRIKSEDLHAPQPPPLANDGDGDVLMQRDGLVTEVHPMSVPIMAEQGWRRCGFDR